MAQSDTIRLTVPAQKQMLLVVRMTTSGVLARMGLTVDDLEDMKMAVEEACGYLSGQEGCRQVQLEYAVSDGTVRVTVSVAEGAASADPKSDEVVRCVLASLADDVTMDCENGGIRSVTLTKRLGRCRE